MNIENLLSNKKVLFSMEVFPPKKAGSVETVYKSIYGLRSLAPDFISVTYGAGGSTTQREKTVEIASLIKSEYAIEPVCHLTCIGATKQEIREKLSDMKKNGITNVLALRGDMSPEGSLGNDFAHASDLARFIHEEEPDFHIMGACYPEKHPAAASIDEDIKNLHAKIDAGVGHLITQLFFDNENFYEFMDKLHKEGIDVPVEAGIMPVTNKGQIERMVTMCGATIPPKMQSLIDKFGDDNDCMRKAGIQYAIEQIDELLAYGVRGIHLYSMNQVDTTKEITEAVMPLINHINNN